MNQILTQDEIDALLNFKENDYQDFERIDPSIPREFDLTNQEKSIQSKIISLGLINEKIARNVRNTLYHFLKKPVDIGISKIKIIHFSEYMKSLPIPSSVNIFKMSPLKGMSLFVFNSRLIYTFVESYFGGEGHTHFKLSKEFTPTENRIAKLLLENFYKDLKDAWSSVIDINFETKSTETNPSMITTFHDKEVFIVSKFKVEGTGGDFDICLPYSMIEPIKELFEAGIHAEHDKNNEKWGQLLKEHLLDVRIDVNCVLARKKVLLKDIMKFKDGDIINIAIPEEIVIKSADIPLFSGAFGTFDSKYAIKVNKKSK